MPFYTYLPVTTIQGVNCRIAANIESPPTQLWGVILMCVRRCPTFPPGLGSIIGAGRLSFRVRDGSGRFPVAISAVTLFTCVVRLCLVVGCGCLVTVDGVVAGFGVCKFSAG